jgi:glyoxylase-like metal-dependent hydrolase (beta-lactamase superfamily II)
MPRFVKVALVLLVVLLGAAAVAYRTLTAREAVPDVSDYAIDLSELRRVAGTLPGDHPVEIRSALLAETTLPRGAVFAGESLFQPQPFVHQIFDVKWKEGMSLLIDAGYPPALRDKVDAKGRYDDAVFARAVDKMRQAALIVVTHEHFDHVGGVGGYEPPEGLVGRLRLTKAQLGNQRELDAGAVPAAIRKMDPLPDRPLLGIAPGVVLMKAPGHTPGSQIVYVHLDDDREYLFIGDIAWHLDQITKLHYRPKLVTDWFLGEDRRAVLAQFRSLHDFMRANPQVFVVVSHDPDERKRLLASEALLDGFTD